MTVAKGTAREFLARDSFYDAIIQDDGAAKAKAVRKAETSLAAMQSTLAVPFEDDVRALMLLLAKSSSASLDTAHIDSIAQASDRIIDVADTLGYPLLSRIARSLRDVCVSSEDAGSRAPDTFAVYGKALQFGLERRQLTGTFASITALIAELRRSSAAS